MTTPRRISLAAEQGPLFRVIAFMMRWRLSSLIRSARNPRLVVVLFAMAAGAVSLSTITMAAMLTKLPLLFPPLGPSAFILFVTPLTPQASPRSVVLSHVFAILVGLAALHLVVTMYPQAGLTARRPGSAGGGCATLGHSSRSSLSSGLSSSPIGSTTGSTTGWLIRSSLRLKARI